MALTGKAAYMGNTLPAPLGPDGEVNFSDPKYSVPIDGDKNNLYLVSHSTPCRCLHGFDELDDFALRHFALDAGFGAIQRHDFDADKGQVITMIRISSDCREMFIGRGEIVAGFGYDSDNCNGGFVFRVADEHDFFEKHVTFGLHLPLCVRRLRRPVRLHRETPRPHPRSWPKEPRAMPDKAIMDRLLAAKRGAALVCNEFESDRAAGTLDASRVESLVRRFILAKFRLDEEEAAPAGDNLEKLAQASLAKMLKIAPDLVKSEDKAANCDGADSATVKQALMIMALQKEFHMQIDCFRAGLCHSVGELAALVWQATR